MNLITFDDNISDMIKEGACGKKNLRLKAARAEHDMTQGDLAEVGATRQTIG